MPPSSYTVDLEGLDLWFDNHDQTTGPSMPVQDAHQMSSSLSIAEKKDPFMNATSCDLCVERLLFGPNITTPIWARNNTPAAAQLPSDHATKPHVAEENDAINLAWNCYSSPPACNNP